MTKKFLLLSAFACGLVFSPSHDAVFAPFSVAQAAGQTASEKTAENFVHGVTERGIGFLSNPNLTHEERIQNFEKLLSDNFDMKTIGRFALGRYWRSATDAQKKEYLKLFEDMVVHVYSQRFDEYHGQSIEIRGTRPEGKSDVMVTTAIVTEDSPEVQVDWRVRNKNGTYKIIDIMVEGVSMALTQRSDFASVIQRGGGNVSVLLAHLQK